MRAKHYIAAAVFICAALSVFAEKHIAESNVTESTIAEKHFTESRITAALNIIRSHEDAVEIPVAESRIAESTIAESTIAESNVTESRITAALNIIRSHEDAVEIPVAESLAGHSFYPDILLSPSQEPSLILVVSLPADTDIINASIAAVSNTVAVLFVAPRNTPNAAGLAAANIIDISPSIPRALIEKHSALMPITDKSGNTLPQPRQKATVIPAVPGNVSPLWLVQSIRNAAIAGRLLNVARLYIGVPHESLSVLLQEGIPAVRLLVSSADDIAPFAAETAKTLQQHTQHRGIQHLQQTNYIFIPTAFAANIIINEQVIIWYIIIIITLCIIYYTHNMQQTWKYMQNVFRYFPLLLLFFVLVLIGLMIGNVSLKTVTPHPQSFSALFLLGKFSLSILIFAVSTRFLHLSQKKASETYTPAAVMLFFAALLIVLTIKIAIAFILAYIISILLLYDISRRYHIHLLLIAVLIIPLMSIFFSFQATPDTAIINSLLIPPVLQEAVPAAFLLAFLLIIYRSYSAAVRSAVITLASCILAINVAVLIAVPTGSSSNALIIEELHLPTRYEVRALSTAQNITVPMTITLPWETHICEQLPCRFTTKKPEPLVDVDVTVQRTAQSTQLQIILHYTQPAEYLHAVLHTDIPSQVSFADPPWLPSAKTENASFPLVLKAGQNPPAQTTLTLVLHSETIPNIHIALRSGFNSGTAHADIEKTEIIRRSVWAHTINISANTVP